MKLYPCPFCGGDQLSPISGNTYGGFYVICWTCITKGPRRDTEDGAKESWNNRTLGKQE